MANSEQKLLEERLTVAAKQVLEELKAEGVAEDELEFAGAHGSPAWDCFVAFKRASSDDSFLKINFTLTQGEDAESVAKRVVRNQINNDENWEHG